MLVSFLLLVAQPRFAAIDSYLQVDLKDISFRASKVSGDQTALAKINRDFGTSYKFDWAQVSLKEPLMLRVESDYSGSKVLMVENGAMTVYSFPVARIRRSRDLTHSPGGRQSFLDFGLLTASLFDKLYDAAFVSEDAAAHRAVFDLTFKKSPDYIDTSRQRITVDTERLYTSKREWYGQDGKLKATFLYLEPKQTDGHWLPTDVQVRNKDGELAGETRASDIKVNSGLDDKLFAVK